jgi:hypothetical protein
VNGEVGENGLDTDLTATTKALGELQFEEEDDEAYYNKVWSNCYTFFIVMQYSKIVYSVNNICKRSEKISLYKRDCQKVNPTFSNLHC